VWDWQEDANERELEQAAQRFIKQQELAAAKERQTDNVAAALAAESHQATVQVAASVEDGLKAATRVEEERRKRAAQAAAEAGPSKRVATGAHLWGLPEEEDDSDDSDDDAPPAPAPTTPPVVRTVYILDSGLGSLVAYPTTASSAPRRVASPPHQLGSAADGCVAW
jgi:hypothetical protein